MNKSNILIYGFGRMGLTHYTILNQIMANTEFVFVDPDKKINYFAKRNLNAKIVSNDNHLHENFHYALICTPPMFHIPILNKCIRNNVSRIFVEKPFGGYNDDFSNLDVHSNNIKIGYVLRFNPIIQWVKKNIDTNNVIKVEANYFSNTLEKKPSGWRNSNYSGVTNEIGSHIIDLCIYLFGLKDPEVLNKNISSIISDVDDILIADLVENHIDFHFHFDWVNKNYRKPVFNFTLYLNDNTTIKFDQQKIESYINGKLINKITSVDLAQSVPFYLRGIDFTNQMNDFIGNQMDMASVKDSLITRGLINKLCMK